jgi:polyhydroxyalkanoate synthase subunit PhaC
MPYRMHSEYLRQLFLNNDLAEGHLMVDGKPVTLADIRVPIFAVGTEWDHVAPWRSTYKINLQVGAEVTYLLTNGGHNAGIISEPGYPGRRFRVATKKVEGPHLDPDGFLERATRKEGSWWPEWSQWLSDHAGTFASLPAMGAPQSHGPLADSPGTYVLVD